MAIERVLLSGDRILLTKPGFAAVASVPEEGKVFDSNWDFTGTLLGRGAIVDTSAPSANNPNLTSNGSPQQAVIPLIFTPRDVLFLVYVNVSQGVALRDFTTVLASRLSFSGGVLSIARVQFPGSSPPLYLRTNYVYRAYSI